MTVGIGMGSGNFRLHVPGGGLGYLVSATFGGQNLVNQTQNIMRQNGRPEPYQQSGMSNSGEMTAVYIANLKNRDMMLWLSRTDLTGSTASQGILTVEELDQHQAPIFTHTMTGAYPVGGPDGNFNAGAGEIPTHSFKIVYTSKKSV